MAKRKQRASTGKPSSARKKAASKRGKARPKARATLKKPTKVAKTKAAKKATRVAKTKTAAKKAIGRGGRKVTAKKGSRSVAAKTKARKQPTKARAKRPTPKKAALLPSKLPKPPNEAPDETFIVDIVEEPAPGVVVVTEFEAVRRSRPQVRKPQIGPEEGSGLGEQDEEED